ncbi:MAG: HNH endonuclease [Bradyrhizobium sp.]|nr:HNH endonuclease [Bradyrhizobium sp.]
MKDKERKPLSKKIRFDVFKRDGFQCQYCGNSPPAVILEIDHIHPVSQGGDNSKDNLLTSCFDCNRGKSDGLLTTLPETVAQKAEILAEKLAQIKAFERLLLQQKKSEESAVSEVENALKQYFPNMYFSPASRASVKTFLKSLDRYQLCAFMDSACSKKDNPYDAWKYFCGICWNVIKGKGYGAS